MALLIISPHFVSGRIGIRLSEQLPPTILTIDAAESHLANACLTEEEDYRTKALNFALLETDADQPAVAMAKRQTSRSRLQIADGIMGKIEDRALSIDKGSLDRWKNCLEKSAKTAVKSSRLKAFDDSCIAEETQYVDTAKERLGTQGVAPAEAADMITRFIARNRLIQLKKVISTP